MTISELPVARSKFHSNVIKFLLRMDDSQEAPQEASQEVPQEATQQKGTQGTL